MWGIGNLQYFAQQYLSSALKVSRYFPLLPEHLPSFLCCQVWPKRPAPLSPVPCIPNCWLYYYYKIIAFNLAWQVGIYLYSSTAVKQVVFAFSHMRCCSDIVVPVDFCNKADNASGSCIWQPCVQFKKWGTMRVGRTSRLHVNHAEIVWKRCNCLGKTGTAMCSCACQPSCYPYPAVCSEVMCSVSTPGVLGTLIWMIEKHEHENRNRVPKKGERG